MFRDNKGGYMLNSYVLCQVWRQNLNPKPKNPKEVLPKP